MRATTGALVIPPHTRKIAAAIADHGRAISGKPSPHKFTILTLLHPFPGFWINALHQESVSPGMHAIANFAFACHTRTQELSHAKFIVCSEVKQLLQLQAGLPRPGF